MESQFYRPSAHDFGRQKELSVELEDVFFASADGIRLHGWFIPAGDKSIGTVIHFHGSDPYASYSDHIQDKMAQLGPLWLVQSGAWLVTSDDFAADRAIASLAPTPILLIHGTADRAVQPYHSERLYQLAADPKEIWRIEGGGHLDAMHSGPLRTKFVQYLTRACESAPAPKGESNTHTADH